MITQTLRRIVPFLSSLSLIISIFVAPATISAATIQVPQDQPTIQAGINAAQDGDLVLVSPGTYTEQLTLSGKTITLASQFHTTGNEQFISSTVIDGGGGKVITVNSSVGPSTKIIGFTIRNGSSDGIKAYGKLHILNNHFINNGDAIDYESSGGICRNNVFENNSDDAVDLDGATAATIENNTIRNNGDDGIEVRLHQYSGPTLNIIIRGNTISGNDEDGIQLIDYPDVSARFFLIERNLIQNNAMVGLGLMDNGVTTEDFRAASIPERIHLFNNTFVGNPYGVTGGDNLIALNNLFVNSTNIAVKNVDAGSIAAYNLFWNNGTDNQGSNIDPNTTLFADPLLDSNYQLQLGSPAIDAGTARFERNGETVLDLPNSNCAYSGTAPDLGTFEHAFTPPPLPTITSFMPISGPVGAAVTITGTGFACATTVAFNGTAASSFTVIPDTEIQATVPSGATTGPISVTAPAGTADSASDFTVMVPPPSVNLLLKETLRLTEEQRAELDRRLDAYEADGNRGRLATDAIAEIRSKL